MSQSAPGAPRTFPLSELKPGAGAVVARIEFEGLQRRRLLDLGIVPGTAIRAELDSPMGDPRAYLVRGALIALRNAQAARIVMTEETD